MAYYKIGYFLLLLPITLIMYQIAPKKLRWFTLFISSVVFGSYFSKKFIFYVAITAAIAYAAAFLLDIIKTKTKKKQKELEKEERKLYKKKQKKLEKLVCVCGVLIVLGILLYLKYYNFFAENVNNLAGNGRTLLRFKQLVLPLGISFYTMQAIGYVVDVYWDKTKAQKNPLKLLLFLSFFPTIMEGPIAAYTDVNEKLYAGEALSIDNLAQGYIRVFWGVFKKLVIADRLYVIVTELFDNAGNYHGAYIAAASIIYTIQLYMEFSGCIDIVIGSAKMFGIKLPENFRQPFLAKDASEFWRRWHISLGVWFKTYIFYPVAMSKPVKKWTKYGAKHVGKYVTRLVELAIALLPVWLANGLWHGAAWSYICYGIYYFVVILMESALEPVRTKVVKCFKISDETSWYKWLRRVKTWLIIFTGELFFRAETLKIGINMFKSMFDRFSVSELFNGSFLNMGLDRLDWWVVALCMIVVIIVGALREKHEDFGVWLAERKLAIRWFVYIALIVGVILLGVYGPGHEEVDLIYAGF
ncbi:MAG: MBOAT family protein [Lachnospiraceae bacterium]|nr:MBOAT family protein [Lachnospiraceae bacterium]